MTKKTMTSFANLPSHLSLLLLLIRTRKYPLKSFSVKNYSDIFRQRSHTPNHPWITKHKRTSPNFVAEKQRTTAKHSILSLCHKEGSIGNHHSPTATPFSIGKSTPATM
ncbi:hypothetical protein BJ742DRAFT_425832 [Cladochytrium replicatum]|nr:hypothetical protein BJ742DRAFT_425832 [Cladochytrium replicatum]